MVTIEKVDIKDKGQVNRFVEFHYKLYAGHPQWVPPFITDIKTMMNPEKHPFYEHSEAEFFVAKRDGKMVGRIAALENKPFNKAHNAKDAEFYLFDTIDDQEVSNALFNRLFEWARARGLNHIVGPKGFSGFDGYGIQIEGFEHRQMMNMMNYNFPYYSKLVEAAGFSKEVDFISCYVPGDTIQLPPKVQKAADLVLKRGTFEVSHFRSKRELIRAGKSIGEAYNKTFVHNWEYYPLTEREIKFVVDNIMLVADHRLIKLIYRNGEVVGFAFGFPDISAAMQRAKGHLNPLSLADLMLSLNRTNSISFNGIGVLPEYHGLGGNALMMSEMLKSIKDFHYVHGELTQVAETAVQMRKDLINLGGKPYKNHRVYQIHL